MVVVVSIVAVFTVLGLPAIRAFIRSVESGSSARAMISAALSSGRAIAAREQHYAGIRFQNKYQQDGKGCQYMVFIVQDSNLFDHNSGYQVVYGFRAVEGIEPIKLPDSVGVMEVVSGDSEINEDNEFTDKTTFSIIFSPSGKLVIHKVQVLRKNDYDTVFNTPSSLVNPMFEDDYDNAPPFEREPSKNSFIIYDRTIFEKVDKDNRYVDYLKDLEVVYINPYTGTMIEK
jgi:Tfp pilus assembly protein FimT